jgi:hypothetical protein
VNCVSRGKIAQRSGNSQHPSRGLTAAFAFALMPVKLFLQIGLSVNGLRQGTHRYFEDFVAVVAGSDDWSCTQPLNNFKTTL